MEKLTANRKKSLSREQALSAREDYSKGMTWAELSKKYSVSICTLSRVLNGTHVSLREEV